MPVKPPVPRYGRQPFEVCTVLSFMLSSISLALFGPTGSANDLTATVQIGLGMAIVAGSVLVLVGVFHHDVITGAVLELAGLFLLCGCIAVWLLGVTSHVQSWSSGLAAAALVASLGGCVWRGWQIVVWFRWIYHDHPPEFWAARQEKLAITRVLQDLESGEIVVPPPASYPDEDES